MRYGSAIFIGLLAGSALPTRAQEVAHTATPTVIRSETRLVLVDTVVTDKKGQYLANLTQKDFKVYNDNKEQPITTFSYEADPASPRSNDKHYMVLFFDNASVSPSEQVPARTAAQKFVDSNIGPNQYIAVVNFSGSLKVTQNFTNDVARLREVLSRPERSAVETAGGSAVPTLRPASLATLNESDAFGVRSVLLALRGLAKGMESVQGRKILVLLSAGFPYNSQVEPELKAAIAACNRSNVSVYPLDVRGLAGMMPGADSGGRGVGGFGGRGGREEEEEEEVPMARIGLPGGSPRLGSFMNSFAPQARGGGGVGGGGVGGGAGGGSARGGAGGETGGTAPGGGGTAPGGGGTAPSGRGGSLGTPSYGGDDGARTGSGRGVFPGPGGGINNPNMNPNMNRPPEMPRTIIPQFPDNASTNQQVLYMLAEGTGGFVIINTNDLLGGLEKINKEQNQYYVLGFSPPEFREGTCHVLRVKVNRGGANIRSRSGYCDAHQVDPLAGKPEETELESIAAGSAAGNIVSPLQLPFFYAAPNVARINLAMEIPGKSFKFTKVKGKYHSEMNVLGLAYRPEGAVGARFSDTIRLDLDSKDLADDFARKPYHYEAQFNAATGNYNVKVVFSAGGQDFGKIEKPLQIDNFDGKELALSDVVLTPELKPAVNALGLDALLDEDRTPMAAVGYQAVPAAVYRFKKSDPAAMYFEVYEPGMSAEKPPTLDVVANVVNLKTGVQQSTSGRVPLANYVHAGNPVIPVLLNLPIKNLAAGSYRLEVIGMNSAGKTAVRWVEFQME